MISLGRAGPMVIVGEHPGCWRDVALGATARRYPCRDMPPGTATHNWTLAQNVAAQGSRSFRPPQGLFADRMRGGALAIVQGGSTSPVARLLLSKIWEVFSVPAIAARKIGPFSDFRPGQGGGERKEARGGWACFPR